MLHAGHRQFFVVRHGHERQEGRFVNFACLDYEGGLVMGDAIFFFHQSQRRLLFPFWLWF